MNSVLSAVSRLVHLPGRPASVITWKIAPWEPGITIQGFQLTGLAGLSYNCKVDFVAFNQGAGISAKRASPAHVISRLVL